MFLCAVILFFKFQDDTRSPPSRSGLNGDPPIGRTTRAGPSSISALERSINAQETRRIPTQDRSPMRSVSQPRTLTPSQARTLTPSQPRTLTPSQPSTLTPSQPRTLTPSQPRTLTPSRPGKSPGIQTSRPMLKKVHIQRELYLLIIGVLHLPCVYRILKNRVCLCPGGRYRRRNRPLIG